MIRIDLMSRKPIYDQLVDRISQLIIAGVYPACSQLPSVRSLSCQLSVNPNTIQKAYTHLCNAGITYSVAGKGCFVSPNAKEVLGQGARGQLPRLGEFLNKLLDSGIDPEELTDYIQRVMDERRENRD
ncbi:MAG: GntR family transcriptional regulator [Clostridia bacterium]|nr:GntR family transcriptional regulator [Clostridia bacterium]